MASPVVCGIGQASVDFLGVSPGPLGAESRATLKEVSIQGGGGAATALVAAAALGAGTRLHSSLADDELGRLALRGLRAAGVDLDGFLAGAAALLLDSSDPAAQLCAARGARRRGVPVFVDVSAAEGVN